MAYTSWEGTEVNQEAEGCRGLGEMPVQSIDCVFHGKEGVKQGKRLKMG